MAELVKKFLVIFKNGGVDIFITPFNNLSISISNFEFKELQAAFTPLMYAVLFDNPGIVNLLLDGGANPNIRSPEGKTAWDYARELPNNARLRTWKAFERLRNATS